jgi:hypothetical protein
MWLLSHFVLFFDSMPIFVVLIGVGWFYIRYHNVSRYDGSKILEPAIRL